jgi:hypothetical protein
MKNNTKTIEILDIKRYPAFLAVRQNIEGKR